MENYSNDSAKPTSNSNINQSAQTTSNSYDFDPKNQQRPKNQNPAIKSINKQPQQLASSILTQK